MADSGLGGQVARGIGRAVLGERPVAVDVQRVDAGAHVDRADHERVAGVRPGDRRVRIAVAIRAVEQRRVRVRPPRRSESGSALRLSVLSVVGFWSIVHNTNSRKLPLTSPGASGLVGVDVDERARVDLGARDRVVVGGALRLDDELADQAVAPVVDAVDVVVPEDVVEHDVREPDLLDELGADPLVGGMGVARAASLSVRSRLPRRGTRPP